MCRIRPTESIGSRLLRSRTGASSLATKFVYTPTLSVLFLIFRALQIPPRLDSGCEIAGVQLRDAHQCDFELGGGVGIDTAVENAIGKA